MAKEYAVTANMCIRIQELKIFKHFRKTMTKNLI